MAGSQDDKDSGRCAPGSQHNAFSDMPNQGLSPQVRLWPPPSAGHDDWHPDSPDSALLQARRQLKPSSVGSSVVRDNGDTQYYGDVADDRKRIAYAPSDFIHVGARFDDETNTGWPRASLTESELNIRPQHGSGTSTPGTSYNFLQNAIVKARVESKGNREVFLPRDSLERIITVPNIEKELIKCGLDPPQYDPVWIAERVWEVKLREGRLTTRCKIFAVLAMMKKSTAILDVLAEDIYDDDLPFHFASAGNGIFRKQKSGVDPVPVQFLQDWEIHEQDSFERYQWQMIAPYFKLSWEPGQTICDYRLEEHDILPFVEETLKESSPDESVVFSGGQSTVHIVRIHKAHYKLRSQKPNTVGDKNSCFAVKKLKMTWNEQSTEKGGQMLAREVKALKRFVDFQDKDKAHHHLIRLLAVYTHRNQLHMILPCADGNLQYFWQEHYPIPNTRDLNLIKWVARQCLGLARALQSIHISHVVGPNAEELEPRFRDQRHGRHGDLKPENILWFGPGTYEGDKEPLGVLVVSDFGLADFHKSQSVNAKGQGYTPTYRAPEWDVIGKVSPAYDIWSLGCVLLEFVVWCIRGWDGVDKFSEKRTDDSESPIPADNFFNFNTTKSVAKAKFSVQREIDELRKHHACSDFFLDLLDYINSDLLRMDPEKRAECHLIVRKLETLYDNCGRDPRYCTERLKEIKPMPAPFSELAGVKYTPSKDPINLVRARAAGPSPDRARQASIAIESGINSGSEPNDRTPLLSDTREMRMAPKQYGDDTSSGSDASILRRVINSIGRIFCCYSGTGRKQR